MNYLDKLYSGAEFVASKAVSIGLVSKETLDNAIKNNCLANKTISVAKIVGVDETRIKQECVDDVYSLHNNVCILETPKEYIISMLITRSGDFRELRNEPKCANVGSTYEEPLPDTSVSIGLYEYRTKLNSSGLYHCVKSHVVPEKVFKLSDEVCFMKSPYGRYYVLVNS